MERYSKNSTMEQESIILDSIVDGVFTVDNHWRIVSFNHAAEKLTGMTRDEAVGSRCCKVFEASTCEDGCALRQTLETGRPITNKVIYIVGAHGERVPVSISTAPLKDKSGRTIGGVETLRDMRIVDDLRQDLTREHTFENIISRNHEMRSIFDILPEVAESDSSVLIEGASGTGKELFARAIHNLSPRRHRPMVTVNCGALPDTLLESELFGHKAGAFTDAKRDKPGRFALAEGGTIFLDEIGDISPAFQAKLLRFLQEKTYEPLGGAKSLKADIRVIAATNKDLDELVREGRFRLDLYYRINVVRLKLPPLRDRAEDIPLLVNHFIARLNRLRSKAVADVSSETLVMLMNHDYPGNVRELENMLEHAFVMCKNGLILPHHLPQFFQPGTDTTVSPPSMDVAEEIDDQSIEQSLRRNNWNRAAAARELGIHRTTLWRKIKQFDIELPDEA